MCNTCLMAFILKQLNVFSSSNNELFWFSWKTLSCNKQKQNEHVTVILFVVGWVECQSSSAFLRLQRSVYLKISTSYYTLLRQTVTKQVMWHTWEYFSSPTFVFTRLIRCHGAWKDSAMSEMAPCCLTGELQALMLHPVKPLKAFFSVSIQLVSGV